MIFPYRFYFQIPPAQDIKCGRKSFDAFLKLVKTLSSAGFPSSETQELLLGTMRYFRASNISGAKVYFKGWKASSAFEINFRAKNVARSKISHRPD